MSFLAKLIGAPVVDAAEGIANIVDKFVETPDEKAAAEIIKMKMMQEPNRAQVELNKIGAGHRSLFVAGWRPFIGWICGLGLFNMFLLNPWIQWLTCLSGACFVGPELPEGVIMELVLGMLGLGALRTYEKHLGVTK